MDAVLNNGLGEKGWNLNRQKGGLLPNLCAEAGKRAMARIPRKPSISYFANSLSLRKCTIPGNIPIEFSQKHTSNYIN